MDKVDNMLTMCGWSELLGSCVRVHLTPCIIIPGGPSGSAQWTVQKFWRQPIGFIQGMAGLGRLFGQLQLLLHVSRLLVFFCEELCSIMCRSEEFVGQRIPVDTSSIWGLTEPNLTIAGSSSRGTYYRFQCFMIR